jgi:hypothetical protein
MKTVKENSMTKTSEPSESLLPSPESVAQLKRATGAYDSARSEFLALRSAWSRMNAAGAQMTSDIRATTEKDIRDIIERAKTSSFDPWSLAPVDVKHVEMQHTRLLRALERLVEHELPAAGRNAQRAQADLLDARAGVLDSILQKRLALLAELSEPIRRLEGTAKLEIDNRDHFTTKLLVTRNEQFAFAARIKQEVEALEAAAKKNPAAPGRIAFDPDRELLGEADYLAIITPPRQEDFHDAVETGQQDSEDRDTTRTGHTTS